jgi:predicted lipid-binding transport protein (Tim44 family)
MNPIKTTFFLTGLTLLLVAMGSAVGGQTGMFVALAVACGMNLFSSWSSDKIIPKMYPSREVSETEHSAFRGMLRRLAPSDRNHPQGVRTMKRQVGKVFAVMFAAVWLSVSVFELNAEARAGKSRSSGSRGAQSYSKPAAPAAQPSPTRQQVAPAPTANPQQVGGGFMRSMAGGIMGGMLGSMLFSSFAGAGDGAVDGMGGSGFGLFEILLLAGGGYFLFRYISRRRAYATATASGPNGYQREAVTPMVSPQQNPTPLQDQLEVGLDHIRRMDPSFDPSRFNDAAMDSFFKIQGAWMNRDLAPVSGLLSEEMAQIFQADLDQLLQDKQINKLENIAVRKVEIVEASQELGHDYVTVSIYANLLDFTIDEMTGAVLSGSKEDPVKFREYWTFTRPVGNNPWRLTAIRQQ